MKKCFKSMLCGALLLSAVSSSAVFASTLFDLHAQHFSTAENGDMTEGRYDLDFVYASTNSNREDGSYTTENDNGFFNVDIKSPIDNWGVVLSVDYAFSTYERETRSISFIADNGASIIISLSRNGVLFNGEQVYTTSTLERLTISLSQSSGDLTLVVNASPAVSVAQDNFQGLKSVEVQLVRERTSAAYYASDALNSLVVADDDSL